MENRSWGRPGATRFIHSTYSPMALLLAASSVGNERNQDDAPSAANDRGSASRLVELPARKPVTLPTHEDPIRPERPDSSALTRDAEAIAHAAIA